MATIYHFMRGAEALRVVHDGAALISGEGDHKIVQRFASGRAARERLDGILLQRLQAGYRLETSTMELKPGQLELEEVAEFVQWDEASGRMTATFMGDGPAPCQAIVACAAATRPSCLCVVGSPGPAFALALTAAPLPSVRRFVFDAPGPMRGCSPGDLGDVLAGLPGLESAFIRGELTLRPSVHPYLRELWLLGEPWGPAAMSAMGRCSFPALERLGVGLGVAAGLGPDRSVQALQALDAAELREVAVEGIGDLEQFLAQLLVRPLPGRWSRMYLNGAICDEQRFALFLEHHRVALAPLESLALPLCDGLSGAAEARVRGWLPSLVDCEEVSDPFLPGTYEGW